MAISQVSIVSLASISMAALGETSSDIKRGPIEIKGAADSALIAALQKAGILDKGETTLTIEDFPQASLKPGNYVRDVLFRRGSVELNILSPDRRVQVDKVRSEAIKTLQDPKTPDAFKLIMVQKLVDSLRMFADKSPNDQKVLNMILVAKQNIPADGKGRIEITGDPAVIKDVLGDVLGTGLSIVLNDVPAPPSQEVTKPSPTTDKIPALPEVIRSNSFAFTDDFGALESNLSAEVRVSDCIKRIRTILTSTSPVYAPYQKSIAMMKLIDWLFKSGDEDKVSLASALADRWQKIDNLNQ